MQRVGGVRPALAVAAGLLVGGAVSWLGADQPPQARAATAAVLVLCTAVPWAAATPPEPGGLAERVRGVAVLALCAALASAAALVVAGRDLAYAGPAALVPAAAAALVHGLASLIERFGASRGGAAVVGCAVPFVLAGALFVADPWIEWDGGGAGSGGRAAAVYQVNPVASLTALDGGTGLDWQRSRWLYDGPAPGTPGISVIGQYYPSRPSSPWLWSLAAGLLGLGSTVGAGVRSRLPGTGRSLRDTSASHRR